MISFAPHIHDDIVVPYSVDYCRRSCAISECGDILGDELTASAILFSKRHNLTTANLRCETLGLRGNNTLRLFSARKEEPKDDSVE